MAATGYTFIVGDVLALLGGNVETLTVALGLDAHKRGRAWRLRTCPRCGARPARAGAAIYYSQRAQGWRWTHHGHDCSGDLLDLIAAADGLDRNRDLRRVLERAAGIVGLAPNDPGLDRRVAEAARAARERAEREAAERALAIAAMPARWESLDRRSLVGERYLQGRGIDPAALRDRGDVVRFTETGELAVAMRALDTGAIVGIQYRMPGGKAFRCEDWSAADESALVGRIATLDPDGVDIAVLTEGLADTLVATIAWPSCTVFGAAGAARLPTIAAAVAKRVKAIRGELLVIADNDDVGVEHAGDALDEAEDAGLVLDHDMKIIEFGKYHDLADAWRAGWRPRPLDEGNHAS